MERPIAHLLYLLPLAYLPVKPPNINQSNLATGNIRGDLLLAVNKF